jgi:hypothetical protein
MHARPKLIPIQNVFQRDKAAITKYSLQACMCAEHSPFPFLPPLPLTHASVPKSSMHVCLVADKHDTREDHDHVGALFLFSCVCVYVCM